MIRLHFHTYCRLFQKCINFFSEMFDLCVIYTRKIYIDFRKVKIIHIISGRLLASSGAWAQNT